ncbi:MAG: two-component system response regulator OmpR [Pseudomonadota bacterium]
MYEYIKMISKAKILIVDDDSRLRLLLKHFLKDKGFEVDCVADAEQMTRILKRGFYDLIILDWMMPGEDGLSVCRRLHAQENSPLVLMLTANGSENDSITGLQCGADDFLAKPFNVDVLLAHIEAILRRRPRVPASLTENNDSVFVFGAYVLDFAKRCLYLKDKRIDLSSGEFSLLKVLAQHLGKPLSREQLSYLIRGKDSKVDCRFIDTQIYRLRLLLEKDPSKPIYLQTVRGHGYVMVQHTAIP